MAKEQRVSNKYVSWLYEEFRTEKHCLVKHLAFLKNVCYQYLNLMLWVTFCLFVCFFSTSWLVLNQLSLNVLLFSCDPIGEPCLSDPGYSSRTVILESLSDNDGSGDEDGKKAIILDWQNDNFARASRFLYFLCGRSMTTTWKCLISRFVKDVNSRQQLYFSFPEIWYSLSEFNYKQIF